MNEATSIIQDSAHEDAQIIFGTVIDESMNDRVKVTVIATGLGCDVAAQITEMKNASPAIASRPAPATMNVAANSNIDNAINTVNETAQAKSSAESESMNAAANMNNSSSHSNSNNNSANDNASASNGNTNSNFNHNANAASASSNNNNQNAGLTSNTGSANNNGDSPELARAREIAKRLGMINTENQDFDVPAFMRRANEASNDT